MATEEPTTAEEADHFGTDLERARPQRALWTKILVATNILVFVVIVANGGGFKEFDLSVYLRWGANYGPATTAGEYWRLLTAAFLHFGPLHLLLNMWALWDSGILVERLYGRAPFLLIYLGTAVAGNLASLAWTGDLAVSGGASGAVFGIYGALAAFLIANLDTRLGPVLSRLATSTLSFIGGSLFLGAVMPGIDNAAHVGGLVMGLALGFALSRPFEPGTRLSIARYMVTALGYAAVLLIFIPAFPQSQHHWQEELEARRVIDAFIREDQRLEELRNTIWASPAPGTLRVPPPVPGKEPVKRVENELLPGWEEIHSKLAAVPAEPSTRIGRRLAAATRYAKLRVEMYAAWLEGEKQNDPAKLKKADTLGLALWPAKRAFERTFERNG